MPKFLLDLSSQALTGLDTDTVRSNGNAIAIAAADLDADKVLSFSADPEKEDAVEALGTPSGEPLFQRLRPYETEVVNGNADFDVPVPVHYWPLTDASGSLVNLSSPAGTGTAGSGAAYRAGGSSGGPLADTPSYAMSVDGTTNGWALQTSTGTLDTLSATAFSLSCWVYCANTAGNTYILTYGNFAPGGVAGNNSHLSLRLNATNQVVGQLYWNNTALRSSTHTTALAATTWYHIALSHHPTNGTTTYVNGVAGPNATGSVASMGSLSTLSGGSRLMVGAPWSNTAPTTAGLNGRVSHVSLWVGYAMSQRHAQLLYMIGKKGTA